MTVTSDKTLFQSVIKMIDSLATSGNYDTIIHILSLLCLFSVLNQAPVQQQHALPQPTNEPLNTENPLQKLLGGLMKADGGAGGSPLSGALGAALGSPDLLGSLLPLLNNPQVKSKINPTNIASVMGMINNLGGLGGLANLGGGLAAAAQQTNNSKPEMKTKAEKKTSETESSLPSTTEREPQPLKEVTPEAPPPEEKQEAASIEKKPGSRFLNWKTNF